MTASLTDGTLVVGGLPVLRGVGERLALETAGAVAFLHAQPANGVPRQTWTLGQVPDAERFLALARTTPFWMVPAVGEGARLPHETQMALIRLGGGRHLLVVPLFAGTLRFALQWGEGGALELIGDTNDSTTPAQGGLALVAAVGTDPYALLESTAAALAARVPGVVLRTAKPLPDFVDLFGWCTWDAFYFDVSPAKIRAGLESWKAIGIGPRLLIVDDGWQSVRVAPTGEKRLVSLAPNEKFAGTMAPTVAMAKQDYGVERVLVWHAVGGYWGGIDQGALPQYDVRDNARNYPRSLIAVAAWINHPEWWGTGMGQLTPQTIGRFYDDYHQRLAADGVDGVKVDVQGGLEGVAQGLGGRVALTRAARTGLEDSVQRHFQGRLINCMAHATETWYMADRSAINRFSDDFYPNKPESHGPHLWINAAVGLWFGEFLHGDWDMFQSTHPQGAFHAAGRAVSGSPVYVSDKPGQHDAALLRRLVLSDGTVARCARPGRLSPDSLYVDPRTDDAILKIFNHHAQGAVVGAFNGNQTLTRQGTVGPADAPGLVPADAVTYRASTGAIRRTTQVDLSLPPLGWEVVSFAPVVDGLAIVGLAGQFVPGAAITSCTRTPTACTVTLRDAGTLLIWWSAPRPVHIDGRPVTPTPVDGGWSIPVGRGQTVVIG